MPAFASAYLAAALAFLAVDGAWLTFAGPRLYRPVLGPLLADKVSLAPAAAFYAIYVAGVVALAVAPAARDGGWTRALALGAVLGFVAYATYDLTNHATLKLWSWKITLLDMAWGAFATALAAAAGCLAMRAVQRAFG